MTANSDQLLSLVDKAISEANGGSPGDFSQWRENARMAIRAAVGESDPVMKRFDDISYSLSAFSERTPQSRFVEAQQSGVRSGIAILHAVRTEIQLNSSEVPLPSPAGFHKWFADAAASLWESGHQRQAVEEAARSIEVQLRAKLGAGGGTGSQLVTSAFSSAPPKEGDPRLRFEGFEPGTESWTNAHEGAMHFGRGCMMRVRNLYAHGHEPSDTEALEAIAALSLLARWVDEAVVQTVDDGDAASA